MNEFLQQFHLLRPLWLLALLPALALAVWLGHSARRRSQWQQHVDPALLPFLLEGRLSRQQRWPLAALLLMWALATLGLAGPTWEQRPQPLEKDSTALVLLWDLSPSMYAQDLKPSRLVRARLKLNDLLDTRDEGQTALVAYAGDAHVVTPLTDDVRTIKSLLPGLDPAIMPAIGSQPEAALSLALNLLQESGVAQGSIVFLTDDIAPAALDELRQLARGSRHHIAVWGLGSEAGAPIPLPQGGFLKDRRGEMVIARASSDAFSDAAVAMGAEYVPFSADARDIDTLRQLGSAARAEAHAVQRNFDQWHEQGHWLALLLLPLVALSFRRGWVLCLCLGLGLGLPTAETQALGWRDLWQTRDQQAQEHLQAQDYDQAAATFKDPDWKAIADYKAGDFDAAASHFAEGDSARDLYNLGNALTQRGDYAAAISAYEQALSLRADFTEAQHNKEIAEQLKALEEAAQSSQEGQNQDGDPQQGEQQGEQQGQQQNPSGQEGQQQGEEQQGQNQQGEGQQGQNGEDREQGDEAQANPSEPNEADAQAQQEALERHFSDEDNAKSAEPQPSEAGEEGEQAQPTEVTEAQASQDKEDETGGENAQVLRLDPEAQQQREQEQALEQWLRRVPDDPTGLLRNKFNHEYQQRRRESLAPARRNPDGSEEQRW